MKYLKYPLLILVTISLNAFLDAQHANRYDDYYEQCGEILRKKAPETWTREMQFECVESQTDIKILGTLLFREGFIFK